MRWQYFDVDGLPIMCTVCKQWLNNQLDVYYDFVGATEEDYDLIAEIWKIDPFTDFAVCMDCVQGHFGIVPGLTAGKWLDDRWQEYKSNLEQLGSTPS